MSALANMSVLVMTLTGAARASDNQPDRAPHRVFASSRFSIDDILKRPYNPDVPMGCVGDRVWASSPQGWAFRDDLHWLYLTNLKAFDVEIRDEHGLLQPARATYYPSHVHLEGATRAVVASASFTFTSDNAQNPLSKPFRPEKRWTCWSSGKREDWYAVDFGAKRRLGGLKIFFFDDAPRGGCRPPESFEVEAWIGETWRPVRAMERKPERPTKGENTILFDALDADRVRLVFRNSGDNFYTGLYGFEPIESDAGTAVVVHEEALEITADKFVTADDVLVTALAIHNPGTTPVKFKVKVLSPLLFRADTPPDLVIQRETTGPDWRASGTGRLHDYDVVYSMTCRVSPFPRIAYSLEGPGPEHQYELGPNDTARLSVTLAIRTKVEAERAEVDRWVRDESPAATQAREYLAWFDSNIAYFDCSDPWIRKMYYHRAYNLRKNTLDPKLGRMQWKTQSEGRWRSTWYPNVISYGGGHQVREARWLRDPSYWQGHLRTFAENQKTDGVYPSHVKPAGPQGGQYTDWITATAWDGHLVHPDQEFLKSVADKLAANMRGWQKVYDPDDDGLLMVDSHWWTGMEWQPSFFSFCEYKTDPKDRMHPLSRDRLERVDLTAYNYGNAAAVARIYRALGQSDKAAEADALARKIRDAVLNKMWDQGTKFFYSLRAEDKKRADVKEVIGVYPFYFDMVPLGEPQGYERAWDSVTDPDEFWTAWPVASASKKCAAYSQDGWPTDQGGSGCMWNGPTWPHANSIVMTAMARTLRGGRARVERGESGRKTETQSGKPRTDSLTAAHLWELFYSFTKAQYRDQDFVYPWTGEFYHGETGKWKTGERDYNHSTWLDVLISDIIGLVARADDTLEIDPLVPADKLSHFLLDGQHYRGHDVAIVWDAPGADDHYGDSRHGLDVYLDGKLVAAADKLTRIRLSLSTGQRLPDE